MIAPALCGWCNEPFLKNAPLANVIAGDGYLRIFHVSCYTELFDEILERENAKILRKAHRSAEGS